ncbi:MAG: hypothetical protein RJA70_4511 [Pseudomonadota bacterium]|jgi:molecular chaperone HscB
MGFEPSFDLDRAELEKRHRELGRALHPDRYGQSGASERRQALSRAIDVNEAYRTLKDPLRRAEALLLRLAIAEVHEPASPAFLMEILEAREALSGAAKNKDIAAIVALSKEFEGRTSALVQSLSVALGQAVQQRKEQLNVPGPIAALIAKELGELRYSRRLVEEAGALLDELE